MTNDTWATLVRHPGTRIDDFAQCGPCDWLIDREDDGQVAAWARTIDIEDCRQHYHRLSAELHYVVQGHGIIELDGREYPVQAGSLVHIPPGVIHSARGQMRVLVVGVPFIAEEDTYYLDAEEL